MLIIISVSLILLPPFTFVALWLTERKWRAIYEQQMEFWLECACDAHDRLDASQNALGNLVHRLEQGGPIGDELDAAKLALAKGERA